MGFVEVFPFNETTFNSTSIAFQVGSNVGDTIDVDLTSINLDALGLASIDLVTFGNTAIAAFDKALNEVTTIRSQWGAVQNRMSSAVAATEVTVESLSASRSRIQDADFATETAQLTRVTILQQAGISILTQANSLPQQALSLLG